MTEIIIKISPEELDQTCALIENIPCYYEPDHDSEAYCPLYAECDRGKKELCKDLVKKLYTSAGEAYRNDR